MGIALGWVAFALAGVGAAPHAERNQAQLTYTVRMVEVDGVGWREAVYTRLKPVTRQGSATVWTVPRDTTMQLVASLAKNPATKILQAPKVTSFSGVPATVQHRQTRPLVTQVAWNGAEPAHNDAAEKLRVGWHTTMIGRKLDQGILVQVVIEDTVIRAVHRVSVNRTAEPKCATARNLPIPVPPVAVEPGLYPPACPLDLAFPIDIDSRPESETAKKILDLLEGSERLRMAGAEWERFWLTQMPAHMTAYRTNGGIGPADDAKTANEERCTKPGACCDAAENGNEDGEGNKVFVEVPEIDTQEVVGEWLIARGEVLLVSFGAHTVADNDGKAVVKERLAIIDADLAPGGAGVAAVPGPLPFIHARVPFLAEPKPIVPQVGLTPMMPSRSIPQGIHADGTPADLPPLPADEIESDLPSSESSEPMASPQTKKIPQPATAPKPKPATDSGTNKAEFTIQKAVTTFLPSLFMPSSNAGFQFLMPVKPLSLKLPFGQRLEVEVMGRVVADPEVH